MLQIIYLCLRFFVVENATTDGEYNNTDGAGSHDSSFSLDGGTHPYLVHVLVTSVLAAGV